MENGAHHNERVNFPIWYAALCDFLQHYPAEMSKHDMPANAEATRILAQRWELLSSAQLKTNMIPGMVIVHYGCDFEFGQSLIEVRRWPEDDQSSYISPNWGKDCGYIRIVNCVNYDDVFISFYSQKNKFNIVRENYSQNKLVGDERLMGQDEVAAFLEATNSLVNRESQ